MPWLSFGSNSQASSSRNGTSEAQRALGLIPALNWPMKSKRVELSSSLCGETLEPLQTLIRDQRVEDRRLFPAVLAKRALQTLQRG